MPKLRFTDLSVRALPEGLHFDERTPGFGIRIGKHRKTWIVVKQPNRTKVRLGHYPALSLADARKKALVTLGSPYEAQTFPAFQEARAEYLAQGTWRPRSRYQLERMLTLYPQWTQPIDRITNRDIIALFDSVKKPSEAWHLFKDLRAFWNWTVPRYLKTSPMHGLKSPSKYIPRERVLTDHELVRVWDACETQGNFGIIIRLCLLTAARRSEIVGPVTFGVDTVTFHGTKNGRDHTLPITPYIRSLFEQVQPIVAWGKPKARLDKASGVTGYTIHDCRRSAATFMARHTDPFIVERILNHAMPSLQRTYNRHAYIEAMRPAIGQHQAWILDLVAKSP